ncbi:S8 family serine peptidase [Weissella diestrammenae]|uniref:S8 family serine peptidase n=1 Tax=Weissella diestrammenae TaxID=1162633 RepID=A0A7G9T7F6_9LACO|nr:S8 family serine peptidase [Weissella diestrammenae]QNN76031.1 S8 family serine peptidase [Weissella diestrammenae]
MKNYRGPIVAACLIVSGLMIVPVGMKYHQQHSIAGDKSAQEKVKKCAAQAYPVSIVKTKADKSSDTQTKGEITPYDDQLKFLGKQPGSMTLAEKSATPIRMTINLAAPSAVESHFTPVPDGSLKTAGAIDQAEKNVVAAQAPIVKRVEEITGQRVTNQKGYLVNAFSIMAKPNMINDLQGISGVKEVTIQNVYQAANTNDNELAQVTDDWRAQHAGDGRGMVIADIDSGIDATHPDLKLTASGRQTAKLSPAATNYFHATLKYGRYESEKVPFAHNYADNIDAQSELKDNGQTGEHGQHVAGILAANGQVTGVAPEAQLLDMKVFSNHHAGATTDAIVDAMEDSVKMGADVLNLSLGAPLTNYSALMPENVAVSRAAKLGVVTVVAASNSGRASGNLNDLHTNAHNPEEDISISGMAASKDAIAVGAMEGTQKHVISTTITTDLHKNLGGDTIAVTVSPDIPEQFWQVDHKLIDNGRCVSYTHDHGLDIPTEAAEGTKQAESGDSGIDSGTDVGKIKIVGYNSAIPFEQYQLVGAGKKAEAVILIDDQDRALPASKKISHVDSQHCPLIFMTKQAGNQLLKDLRTNTPHYEEKAKSDNGLHDKAELGHVMLSKPITTVVSNESKGKMSTFTSWGSTPDLTLKPDITGIGGNIWSLSNQGYAQKSGTSMASPFVAGTVALIKQQANQNHVNLGQGSAKFVQNIKGVLQNTAAPVKDTTNGTYFSPRQQGGGLVQVDRATQANAVITNANDGHTTIDLKAFRTKEKTFKIKIQNVTQVKQNYHVAALGNVQTEVRTTDCSKVNTTGLRTLLDKGGNSTGETVNLNDADIYYYRDEKPFLDLVSESTVNGAQVNLQGNNITLAPGQEKIIDVTLTIPNTFTENNWIEGYLQVTATQKPGVIESIPYFGYYGDWDAGKPIDKPASEKGSIKGYGYLADEMNGHPLATLNTKVVSRSGDVNYTCDNEHAAVTFNHSGVNRALDMEYMLRWMRSIDVDVMSADKQQVLRHLATYQQTQPGRIDTEWNGMLPDALTGQSKYAPDGVYYIRTVAVTLDGAKTQTVYRKLTIDNCCPKAKNVHLKWQKDGVHLSGEIDEKGSGMNNLTNVQSGGSLSYRINTIVGAHYFNSPFDEQQSGWLNGHFDTLINTSAVKNLKAKDNVVEISLRDRAGNGSWFENKLTLPVEGTTATQEKITALNHHLDVTYHGESFYEEETKRVYTPVGHMLEQFANPIEPKKINAYQLKTLDVNYWSMTLDGTWQGKQPFTITAYNSDNQPIDQVKVTATNTHWQTPIKIGRFGYITFKDTQQHEIHQPIVPEIQKEDILESRLDADKMAQDTGGKWVKRGDEQVLVVPNETDKLKVTGNFTGHLPGQQLIYNSQVLDADTHTIRVTKPEWTNNAQGIKQLQCYCGAQGVEKYITPSPVNHAGEINAQVNLWDAQQLTNLREFNRLFNDPLAKVQNYEGAGNQGDNQNGWQTITVIGYEPEFKTITDRYGDVPNYKQISNPFEPLAKYLWELEDLQQTFTFNVYRLPKGEKLTHVKDSGQQVRKFYH